MKPDRYSYACAAVLALALIARGQSNPSFESDTPGTAPASWSVNGGLVIVSATPDDLFPSDGSKYLVVSSVGTGPVAAGYGPHTGVSCGQATAVVARPLGTYCTFSIDWDFLANEVLGSGTYDDFLSIDIVNNFTSALIANVVYVDMGVTGGVPPYTNVPGAGTGVVTWVPDQSAFYNPSGHPAPAGFKRAWVDLSAVTPLTPMRVEISVCNGGDAGIPSYAYIDNVHVWAGERASTGARMRVLSSSHADGLGASADWGGDLRPATPYRFRACPGQRLSIRASSAFEGVPWLLCAGNLLNPGSVQPFGQVNVDVFSGAPYFFPINGFALDPFSQYLGTLTFGVNYYDAQIPVGTPLGTKLTLQAAMDVGGGVIDLSAATELEIGAPQIPIGSATIAGGANDDDSFTFINFAAFGAGSWPFFGVARPSVIANSNGNVTFAIGSPDPTESELEMSAGAPRIAAVWDDLDPTAGGSVKSTQTTTTLTVSWTDVPEKNSSTGRNNFSIQMYQATGPTPAGVFTIYYGSTSMDDGLAGISSGLLPPPGPGVVASSDLSGTAYAFGARGFVVPGTAIFERFAQSDIPGLLRDTCDLMTIGDGPSRITFVPDGAGGYTFFTGTR